MGVGSRMLILTMMEGIQVDVLIKEALNGGHLPHRDGSVRKEGTPLIK